MDIRIKLPTATEGTWKVDQEKGEVVITPRFFKGKPTQVIGYVTVGNEHGHQKKAVLHANGKDGTLKAENITEPQYEAPAFDKVKPKDDRRSAPQDPAVPTADRGGEGPAESERVVADGGVKGGSVAK